MSTASAPHSSGFQPIRGALLEFRRANTEIFIKNAYSLNGKAYDITYGTTILEIQKLQRMDPSALVQTLQEQIRVGLKATATGRSPEKVRFSSEKGRVYAWQNGQRIEISAQSSSLTGRTMKAMMESLSKEHALLQSSLHSEVAVPQPRAIRTPTPPVLSSRLRIPDEIKNTWLNSEMAICFGGLLIGPLRFLAGLIQVIVNLITAPFAENSTERLKDALEGLEHLAMGLFSTIASMIVYSSLIIGIPYAILIFLIK